MAGRKRWKVEVSGGRAAAAMLLASLFALGSVTGCVAAGLLRDPAGELISYLRGYFSLAAEGELSPDVWAVLWQTVRASLVVTVLGFTALGVVGIPLVFLLKGFALCYAVSAFYRLLGLAGLVPALILFGLSAFLWLPVLLELGVRGMLGAYGLLRRTMGDGRGLSGQNGDAMLQYGVCAIALFLCVGMEYFSIPVLLQEIAGFFLSG